MTTISDLTGDLVEEILSSVPITSISAVRSTCKRWNASYKYRNFCKTAVKKQFLGFMMMDHRVCSMKFNLQGIRNEDDGEDFVHPSIKQINKFDKVKISNVFYCNGLLLVVTQQTSRLVVWNPYLGETRRIKHRNKFHRSIQSSNKLHRRIQPRNKFVRFDEDDMYALGYDNNNNYKILRIFDVSKIRNKIKFEIYDFSSNSWIVFDFILDFDVALFNQCSKVSLKGNAYFSAQTRVIVEGDIEEFEDFVLCFEFTRERFVQLLPLPLAVHTNDEEIVDTIVSLSCVREEQLAVLYERETLRKLEIWVTDKVDPDTASWSKFLEVDTELLAGFPYNLNADSFFIDEEEGVAVVFHLQGFEQPKTCRYKTAYIVGQDEYFKSVDIGKSTALGSYGFCVPLVCSSYVPSLVQLQINQPGKRKQRYY